MAPVQLFAGLTEGDSGVGAAESEGIVQRQPDTGRPRMVGNVIKIAVGIGVVVVGGRGQHSTLHREDSVYRFDCAGCTERMAGH